MICLTCTCIPENPHRPSHALLSFPKATHLQPCRFILSFQPATGHLPCPLILTRVVTASNYCACPTTASPTYVGLEKCCWITAACPFSRRSFLAPLCLPRLLPCHNYDLGHDCSIRHLRILLDFLSFRSELERKLLRELIIYFLTEATPRQPRKSHKPI